STSGCLGPPALDPANGCTPPEGTGELVPSLVTVSRQNTTPAYPGCQQESRPTGVVSCTLGSDAADPERVVALVGDSHATHWFSAFDTLGDELGWQVRTFTKSGCPVTRALRTIEGEQSSARALNCALWVDSVRETIAADDSISLV